MARIVTEKHREESARRGAAKQRGQNGRGTTGVRATTGGIDELERAVTHLGRAILRLKSNRIYGSAADNIDRTAYFALVALDEEGPMRLCELAPRLGLDTSTVSRLVSQLDEGGLVIRTRDEVDRRAQLVQPSVEGRALLADAAEARRAMLGEATSGWSPDECAVLGSLMGRLARDMGEMAGRGG